MDHHDLIKALKAMTAEKNERPNRGAFIAAHPKFEAYLAQMGGWKKLMTLMGDEPEPKRHPKILLWDIEATNLNANYGFVICIGYKWYGEDKIHLISLRDFPALFKKDPTDDSLLIQAFAKVMEEADIQVYHYGDRFDFPYIQTRLLEKGKKPLKRVPSIDTWRICKYQLKLTSNRLDTISKVIPVEKGKERAEKTPLDGDQWRRAMGGQVTAIKYIEEHCIADIEVLDQVYTFIRPFAKNTPNIGKFIDKTRENCPACGSQDTNRRGFNLTHRGRKQNYQCQDCGNWFQGRLEKAV